MSQLTVRPIGRSSRRVETVAEVEAMIVAFRKAIEPHLGDRLTEATKIRIVASVGNAVRQVMPSAGPISLVGCGPKAARFLVPVGADQSFHLEWRYTGHGISEFSMQPCENTNYASPLKET